MKYNGHTVFSPNGEKPNHDKLKQSLKRGAHGGRVAFRIEGIVYSIGECLARTGMDEAAFRARHRQVSGWKDFGWDDFPIAEGINGD